MNGLIRIRGTSIGSVAMYACQNGFMLEGDAFRTCQRNGEWSGGEPTCIRESDMTRTFMAELHKHFYLHRYWLQITQAPKIRFSSSHWN